jgi:hypothetical protein
MRYLLAAFILCLSSPAQADSMPIRGATGDGYGQFSWGTSVATVEKLSPKLSLFKEDRRTRFERTVRTQLHKADKRAKTAKGKASLKRVPSGGPRFQSYRHWLKMAGLEGRVTLRFYKDQLFEASVALLYSKKNLASVTEIIDALIAKYGGLLSDAEGNIPRRTGIKLALKTEGGQLSIFRLDSKGGRSGFLKLRYESEVFGQLADQHMDDLRARIAHLKTQEARAGRDDGGIKKRRQKKLMERL